MLLDLAPEEVDQRVVGLDCVYDSPSYLTRIWRVYDPQKWYSDCAVLPSSNIIFYFRSIKVQTYLVTACPSVGILSVKSMCSGSQVTEHDLDYKLWGFTSVALEPFYRQQWTTYVIHGACDCCICSLHQ